MKANMRFIQSVVSSSKSTDVILPWTTGKRRNEFVATNKTQENARQAKAA